MVYYLLYIIRFKFSFASFNFEKMVTSEVADLLAWKVKWNMMWVVKAEKVSISTGR